MTFYPRDQETITEKRGGQFFQGHIRQFVFFAVSFFEISEVVFVFSKAKKPGEKMLFSILYIAAVNDTLIQT